MTNVTLSRLLAKRQRSQAASPDRQRAATRWIAAANDAELEGTFAWRDLPEDHVRLLRLAFPGEADEEAEDAFYIYNRLRFRENDRKGQRFLIEERGRLLGIVEGRAMETSSLKGLVPSLAIGFTTSAAGTLFMTLLGGPW